MKTKPLASLSLDLDNQWSYMKTHGDPGWESFPSYLDIVVPRVLGILTEQGLSITFFIVGQDAALEKNHQALRAIGEAGHEVGNHSFRHEPWLHLYSPAEVETELATAEAAIVAATGRRPIGFRGPGFSLSPTVLSVLKRRGYRYDASTFPSFLGPLARAYYFLTARMPAEERAKRKYLFGAFSEGFRPIHAYRWRLAEGPLIEIPVTTMPIVKIPFHVSYLLYMAGFSPALARQYFRSALRLCRMTGVQPSLLLHPLDFLGCDDVDALSFFPGMSLRAATKVGWINGFLTDYARYFNVLPVGRHADALAERGGLPLVKPRFPTADGAAFHMPVASSDRPMSSGPG